MSFQETAIFLALSIRPAGFVRRKQAITHQTAKSRSEPWRAAVKRKMPSRIPGLFPRP
jgi:hypothetical protein